jgi:hypothetical protein
MDVRFLTRPLPVQACCRIAPHFLRGRDRQYWGYRRKADGSVIVTEYAGMDALEHHQLRGDVVRGPFVAYNLADAQSKFRQKLREADLKRQKLLLAAPVPADTTPA